MSLLFPGRTNQIALGSVVTPWSSLSFGAMTLVHKEHVREGHRHLEIWGSHLEISGSALFLRDRSLQKSQAVRLLQFLREVCPELASRVTSDMVRCHI